MEQESTRDRIEDLRRIAELLDDGKLSEGEYDSLKIEIIDAEPEAPPHVRDAVEAVRGPADDEEAETESSDLSVFIENTHRVYLLALGAAIAAALMGWLLWPLPWLALVLGALALVATDEKRSRWMAWAAIAVGILVATLGIQSQPSTETVTAPALITEDPVPAEIPLESLGITLDELAGQWNAIEQPPFITSQIRPTPESGPLDSFMYRFDDTAVVAGAHDPETGAIYALLARAGIHHADVNNMYVHVCYLLHPGSQGCLDSYVENNDLFGKSLLDFESLEYDQIWNYGGNEWRLTVEANVQTIRVQAPEIPK